VRLILELAGIAEPIFERSPAFSMSGYIARPDFETIKFIVDSRWWHLGRKIGGLVQGVLEADKISASNVYARGNEWHGIHGHEYHRYSK
jgi:hypothetical protein